MRAQNKIERGKAVPLYHQVYLAIREDIVSGKLPYLAKVTEEELADAYSVSRVTAGRALQELADAGLVERRRKVGTRVVYHAEHDIVTILDEGVEPIQESTDLNIQVVGARHGIVRANARMAEMLRVAPDSPLVYVQRSLLHGGEALGLVEYHFLYEFFEILKDLKDEQVSLINRLQSQRRLGTGGTQYVSVTSASAALAAALDIDARAPVIRLERVLGDLQDRPAACTVSHFRGDRYRLALDSQAPTSALLD